MEDVKRRNLSGIYIFDQFATDKHRRPTCIEDCLPSTRRQWAMQKDKEMVRSAIRGVADTFCDVTDYCLREHCVTDEQARELHDLMARAKDRCKWNWAEHELADQLDFVCQKLRMLADAVGLSRPTADSDDDE